MAVNISFDSISSCFMVIDITATICFIASLIRGFIITTSSLNFDFASNFVVDFTNILNFGFADAAGSSFCSAAARHSNYYSAAAGNSNYYSAAGHSSFGSTAANSSFCSITRHFSFGSAVDSLLDCNYFVVAVAVLMA